MPCQLRPWARHFVAVGVAISLAGLVAGCGGAPAMPVTVTAAPTVADLFPEDLAADSTTADAEPVDVEFEPDEEAFVKATRRFSSLYKRTEEDMLISMGWNQCLLASTYGDDADIDKFTAVWLKSGSFEPAFDHLCPENRVEP